MICPLACRSSVDCTSIAGPASCPAKAWPAVEPRAEQPALFEERAR